MHATCDEKIATDLCFRHHGATSYKHEGVRRCGAAHRRAAAAMRAPSPAGPQQPPGPPPPRVEHLTLGVDPRQRRAPSLNAIHRRIAVEADAAICPPHNGPEHLL